MSKTSSSRIDSAKESMQKGEEPKNITNNEKTKIEAEINRSQYRNK